MARVFQAQIIQSCKSPKRVGRGVKYRQYIDGQMVKVQRHDQGGLDGGFVPMFITRDGFIIPESNLNILGVVSEGKQAPRKEQYAEATVVESKDFINNEALSKAKTMMGGLKGDSLIKDQLQKSKYAVNGALIGLGVGVIYAMMKTKNKMVFGGIGAVMGGVAGNMYSKLKTTK